MNLLQALLRNESGGRNVTNVNQSTSSGRARGYFQITDGTWHEFGGAKYAPTALGATYEQQADIASRIPLKRWDPTTIAMMRSTGRPINVNATLGQNLAMNGETFAGGARDGGNPGGGGPGVMENMSYRLRHIGGAPGSFASNPAGGTLRHVGGAGSSDPYFAPMAGPDAPDYSSPGGEPQFFQPSPPSQEDDSLGSLFAKTFGQTGAGGGSSGATGGIVGDPGGEIPPLDYASAVPQPTQPFNTDLSPLADLFQLKTIGQAPMIDQQNPNRFSYG